MKKSKSKFVGVLGGGGRESAFIESLLSDSSVETIFVFHPNGGFANEPRVHKLTLASGTSSEIVKLCKKNEITLVLSGPEAMAIEGVNDALTKAGVSVLGASAKAIKIESDKSWAREFMQKIGLPQPEYLSFTDSKEAIKAATENEKLRVVKAIGPALGKGVIVCDTLADVKKGIKTILVDQKFGDAGKKVVLEERLGWNDPDAQEISVMFYCDGHQLLALTLAQDYKRENDGDQGENTGGVGSHTSPNILSAEAQSFIREKIAQPLVDALDKEDRTFRGILYLGLMKTSDKRHNPYGLFIIEINGRGGDPETQVQLAGQMHPNISEFYTACAQGKLDTVEAPIFSNKAYCNVVLCGENYPRSSSKGEIITGISKTEAMGVKVLHAGTTVKGKEVVTNGGRVLNVLAEGSTLTEAKNKIYKAIPSILFNGKKPKYRTDIGKGEAMTLFSVASLLVDTRGNMRKEKLLSTGWTKLKDVQVTDLFSIDKSLSTEQIKNISKLLHNPVSQEISAKKQHAPSNFSWAVEIGYKPGVTDNVAHTIEEQLELLGLNLSGQNMVHTSQVTFLTGDFSFEEVKAMSETLANPLIQMITIKSAGEWKQDKGFFTDKKIPLHQSAKTILKVDLSGSDEELKELGKFGVADPALGTIGRRGPLSLSLKQVQTIRDYFLAEGREPTDIEVESIAQNWSEHCRHTIFASPIDEIKDGLFKYYIRRATELIRKEKGNKDNCVSVFSDNAGAIIFDDEYLVCDKVETHNSPSALDPFGGSITGIVGVNRDIIGFGMGAKPIMNRYGFCLPNPNDTQELYRDDKQEWPVLTPKQVIDNVIIGVGTGGNCSGIPTTQGFFFHDSRFRAKPLVFAGTVGMIPRQINGAPSVQKKAQTGDLIVVIGGRVGLDGIHGATFSSEGIGSHSPTSAVQIGDPITQKKLSDVIVKEARGQGLFTSITDNGAGGLSCSVTEMAQESGGCAVRLDDVLLKYPGLEPWQIWISESQERMTLAVPPENWPTLEKLLKSRGVEGAVIGEFTDSGRCIVTWQKENIVDVELDFLHAGWPKLELKTKVPEQKQLKPWLRQSTQWNQVLTELLRRPNLRSFADVTTYYDHEVQGSSVVKPLQGKGLVNGDVTAVEPRLGSPKSVVVSHALYPTYTEQDSYAMAAASIDTAVRNLITAGVPLDKIALLDNFCWCSSNDPERLYQLKEATRACFDTAVVYQTPFISGKDSMFNDFSGFDENGQSIKISALPTLLISSIAVVNDGSKLLTPDCQASGELIYLLGETHDELGGSEYRSYLLDTVGEQMIGDSPIPQLNAKANKKLYDAYTVAAAQGWISAAQSVNHGGLIYALSKMCMASTLGMSLNIQGLPGTVSSDEMALFSESQGRIVVSVHSQFRREFEQYFVGQPLQLLGMAQSENLVVYGKQSLPLINLSAQDLLNNYKAHLMPQITTSITVRQTPKALVLSGYGINCEEETAYAFQRADVDSRIIHVDDLIRDPSQLEGFQILAVPGGFSYGDDTGSGLAMANKIRLGMWSELSRFCHKDTLTIGICNGFQVLSNLGLVPSIDGELGEVSVALTHNDNAKYTARWVDLQVTSNSPWLAGIQELSLPIAHGEGKLVCSDEALDRLKENHHVAARYVNGETANWYGLNPNPNGSFFDIAALTDSTGRIFGLMPHPERALSFTQLPHWKSKRRQLEEQDKAVPSVGPGFAIFQNAARYFEK